MFWHREHCMLSMSSVAGSSSNMSAVDLGGTLMANFTRRVVDELKLDVNIYHLTASSKHLTSSTIGQSTRLFVSRLSTSRATSYITELNPTTQVWQWKSRCLSAIPRLLGMFDFIRAALGRRVKLGAAKYGMPSPPSSTSPVAARLAALRASAINFGFGDCTRAPRVPATFEGFAAPAPDGLAPLGGANDWRTWMGGSMPAPQRLRVLMV
jgi:hypothetical protein